MDKKTRVLVLDEPTAALTEQEVAVLLDHLRRLRAQGTTCIYISHKLGEVFAIGRIASPCSATAPASRTLATGQAPCRS